jgi:hypothetical protein
VAAGAVPAVCGALAAHSHSPRVVEVACEALGNLAFRNAGCGRACTEAGVARLALAAVEAHLNDERTVSSALFAMAALPSGAPAGEEGLGPAAAAAAASAAAAHPASKRVRKWVAAVATAAMVPAPPPP